MARVRYLSPEDKVDLALATRGMAWASWYAATYLHAEKENRAVLWFYRVPVKLEQGRNILILQVENLEHYAYFKARISDEKGWPITGVTDSTRSRASNKR